MRFSDKVRVLMKEKHLTQEELAGILGTYQTQVSRWIDTNTPPKSAYLLLMARALGVTVDYLIDPDQKPGSRPDMLTDDDRSILDLVRALGITRLEAMRRLVGGNVPIDERAGLVSEPSEAKAEQEDQPSSDYLDILPGDLLRIVSIDPGDVIRLGSLHFVAVPRDESLDLGPGGEIKTSLYEARSGTYIDGRFWRFAATSSVASTILSSVAYGRPVNSDDFTFVLRPESKDLLVTHPLIPELRLPGDMDYILGPHHPFRSGQGKTDIDLAPSMSGEPIQGPKGENPPAVKKDRITRKRA